MPPSLDIVIVNWNTGTHLQACLHSIGAASRTDLELRQVIVVDNASHDGSASSLNPSDLPLEVVRNDRNRGFAAACNQGAWGSSADYLLFLNPDVELLADSLSVPVAHMERPEWRDVGICGIRLLDSSGAPAVASARFPGPGMLVAQSLGLSRVWPSMFPPQLLAPEDCQVTRDVDQIIGAFFLVRRALFLALGGFDERFFVYFEEVDFSWRARRQGARSRFLAEASARHLGGLSSGQVRARRLFYSLRSRLQFGFKHYSVGAAILVALVSLCVEPVTRAGAALLHLSGQELDETLRAYGMLAADGWRRATRRPARPGGER